MELNVHNNVDHGQPDPNQWEANNGHTWPKFQLVEWQLDLIEIVARRKSISSVQYLFRRQLNLAQTGTKARGWACLTACKAHMFGDEILGLHRMRT